MWVSCSLAARLMTSVVEVSALFTTKTRSVTGRPWESSWTNAVVYEEIASGTGSLTVLAIAQTKQTKRIPFHLDADYDKTCFS